MGILLRWQNRCWSERPSSPFDLEPAENSSSLFSAARSCPAAAFQSLLPKKGHWQLANSSRPQGPKKTPPPPPSARWCSSALLHGGTHRPLGPASTSCALLSAKRGSVSGTDFSGGLLRVLRHQGQNPAPSWYMGSFSAVASRVAFRWAGAGLLLQGSAANHSTRQGVALGAELEQWGHRIGAGRPCRSGVAVAVQGC